MPRLSPLFLTALATLWLSGCAVIEPNRPYGYNYGYGYSSGVVVTPSVYTTRTYVVPGPSHGEREHWQGRHWDNDRHERHERHDYGEHRGWCYR